MNRLEIEEGFIMNILQKRNLFLFNLGTVSLTELNENGINQIRRWLS